MAKNYIKYKTGLRLLFYLIVLSLNLFYGESAKGAETADDNEDDEPQLDEAAIAGDDAPIERTTLNLNGKPFSAVPRAIVVRYFDENPEK